MLPTCAVEIMKQFHTLLIDGDVYLHRAVAAATTTVTFDEESTWRVDLRTAGGYIRNELAALKSRFEAKRVLIALGDRKANFRKELCPTYKANRTNFPKPPGFLELESRLKAHATVVQFPRLEGDDVLGLMLTKPDVEPRLCVSVDKDLLQIPGAHFNPDTEALTVTDEFESRHRHLFQTLTGDRVDGYPGCPGIGEKRAAEVLAGGVTWAAVTAAYEKAGLTEADALLQARLAFVLRNGFFNTKTKEITLWTAN